MHFQSDNSEEANNNPASSFKKGIMIQLGHIFNWLGRTFILAVVIVPFLILLFFPRGEACVMSASVPIIAGAFTSTALVLLLGNPLIGVIAGIVLGLMLELPFIQHFLCQ